jgi:hypothetical protein
MVDLIDLGEWPGLGLILSFTHLFLPLPDLGQGLFWVMVVVVGRVSPLRELEAKKILGLVRV